MDPISAPATFAEAVFRLTFAVVCGAVVGVNREIHQKPAGLRTHALVALGAGLLVIVGLQLSGSEASGSVSRVIQGIMAGIGFIGGGVILHRDDTRGRQGLTTAAAIWLVAGLGVTAGLGLWKLAAVALALGLAVLVGGAPLDRVLRRWRDASKPPDAGADG